MAHLTIAAKARLSRQRNKAEPGLTRKPNQELVQDCNPGTQSSAGEIRDLPRGRCALLPMEDQRIHKRVERQRQREKRLLSTTTNNTEPNPIKRPSRRVDNARTIPMLAR